TLITGPSEETRQVGAQKQERAASHERNHTFWTALLERAAARRHPHSGVSPNSDSWLSAGSGMSRGHFTYTIRQHSGSVGIWIEGRDAANNTRIFETFAAEREAIENEFGGVLEWDPSEGRKRCSITETVSPGRGYLDEEAWPEIQEQMLD